MKTLMRYPGSKAKLVLQITGDAFPDDLNLELWAGKFCGAYCEPFVGAGAMAVSILPILPSRVPVILNDKDYWLVCLWKSALDAPEELQDRIEGFTPTAEAFHQFKMEDGTTAIDPVEAGFRKLALHQISWGGLGVKAGGPLGGKTSSGSEYTPCCRFNKTALKERIAAMHRCLRRFRNLTITCRDFSESLRSLSKQSFVYLDPPYYEKGGQLYKHNMEDGDHARLATILRTARFRWCLSYDDHPRIRELYSGCCIRPVHITYTVARAMQAHRPKNCEVVITPR